MYFLLVTAINFSPYNETINSSKMSAIYLFCRRKNILQCVFHLLGVKYVRLYNFVAGFLFHRPFVFLKQLEISFMTNFRIYFHFHQYFLSPSVQPLTPSMAYQKLKYHFLLKHSNLLSIYVYGLWMRYLCFSWCLLDLRWNIIELLNILKLFEIKLQFCIEDLEWPCTLPGNLTNCSWTIWPYLQLLCSSTRVNTKHQI